MHVSAWQDAPGRNPATGSYVLRSWPFHTRGGFAFRAEVGQWRLRGAREVAGTGPNEGSDSGARRSLPRHRRAAPLTSCYRAGGWMVARAVVSGAVPAPPQLGWLESKLPVFS